MEYAQSTIPFLLIYSKQLSRLIAVLARVPRAATRDAVGQTWCGVRLALAVGVLVVGRRPRGPGQVCLGSGLHLALGVLVHGAGVRAQVEGRRRRHGDGVGRVLGSSRHFSMVVLFVWLLFWRWAAKLLVAECLGEKSCGWRTLVDGLMRDA